MILEKIDEVVQQPPISNRTKSLHSDSVTFFKPEYAAQKKQPFESSGRGDFFNTNRMNETMKYSITTNNQPPNHRLQTGESTEESRTDDKQTKFQKAYKVNAIYEKLQDRLKLRKISGEKHFRNIMSEFKNLDSFVDTRQMIISKNLAFQKGFKSSLEVLKIRDKITQLNKELEDTSTKYQWQFGEAGTLIQELDPSLQVLKGDAQAKELLKRSKKFLKDCQKLKSNQNDNTTKVSESLKAFIQRRTHMQNQIEIQDDANDFYNNIENIFQQQSQLISLKEQHEEYEKRKQEEKEKELRQLIKISKYDVNGNSEEKKNLPNQEYFNEYHKKTQKIINSAIRESKKIYREKLGLMNQRDRLFTDIHDNIIVKGFQPQSPSELPSPSLLGSPAIGSPSKKIIRIPSPSRQSSSVQIKSSRQIQQSSSSISSLNQTARVFTNTASTDTAGHENGNRIVFFNGKFLPTSREGSCHEIESTFNNNNENGIQNNKVDSFLTLHKQAQPMSGSQNKQGNQNRNFEKTALTTRRTFQQLQQRQHGFTSNSNLKSKQFGQNISRQQENISDKMNQTSYRQTRSQNNSMPKLANATMMGGFSDFTTNRSGFSGNMDNLRKNQQDDKKEVEIKKKTFSTLTDEVQNTVRELGQNLATPRDGELTRRGRGIQNALSPSSFFSSESNNSNFRRQANSSNPILTIQQDAMKAFMQSLKEAECAYKEENQELVVEMTEGLSSFKKTSDKYEEPKITSIREVEASSDHKFKTFLHRNYKSKTTQVSNI